MNWNKIYLSSILNACFVAETTLLHTLSGYDYYKVKIVDFLQKEMSFFCGSAKFL